MRRGLAIFVALTWLSPLLTQARVITIPSVEEMENRATLVCNAVVESITKGDTLGPPTGIYQVRMTARIKILHVFKGSAPAEITYYYRAWGWAIPPNATDLKLTKNKRYRFFLVPGTPKGEFTDTQWGTEDELFGIEPLSPKEPDDSPPMNRDEAIRLALAALHLTENDLDPDAKPYVDTCPEISPVKYDGFTDDTRTTVRLSNKTHASQEVIILGDRTIRKAGRL